MAFIKGGVYTPLYSADSQKVNVGAFYIDKYPVTNADYAAFVKQYPEWGKTKVKKLFADHQYLGKWNADNTFDAEIANSPVTNVSWFAAQKYCECQGKRLPSTAEWEIVARAGKTKPDASKDDDFNQWILKMASRPSAKILAAVGSNEPNYFKVYDMHGLVWEWTFDFNSALTTGESRGNSSLDNMLFCGGGSFASKDLSNYASFLRFAMRSSLKAKYAVHNVGFRCVK